MTLFIGNHLQIEKGITKKKKKERNFKILRGKKAVENYTRLVKTTVEYTIIQGNAFRNQGAEM